tara:strand:- start:562 stop:1314 length:753 start_codon:yes stop_codon:yes gene_type:complete
MSKESKKQEESLFISTQQEAQSKPQMLMPGQEQLEFNVEETFKCPIYISKKPEWVEPLNKASDPIIERLKKNWKKKIKDPKDPAKTMPNSLHSELLWQYPEFKEIANLILQQSWNILSWQGYNLTGRIPLLTELWVQEFPEEGGFHDIHEHGNNHISGFYFLKCNEKTSHPVFWDPRPGKKMTDLQMKDQSKINYGSQQVHYKVKPGQFIFFNSYMPHSYVHHKGKDKFRFIHFNLQATLDPNSTTKTTS